MLQTYFVHAQADQFHACHVQAGQAQAGHVQVGHAQASHVQAGQDKWKIFQDEEILFQDKLELQLP